MSGDCALYSGEAKPIFTPVVSTQSEYVAGDPVGAPNLPGLLEPGAFFALGG